ncbi:MULTISPECIES: outer membrane protein [unclassified Legionella]|uniref:outer membrane protein n=1 Tax=unclassified Legionella TaxID=2622702 RepID=UPI0013EF78B5|nr:MULTISPECIES: outer membrane beta-barrel protein [unclassified Legionella]MDI9818080.1 acyloxyacyl hydrolase [Legionella sp. PL877]
MGPAVKPETWYLVGGGGYSHSRDAGIRVDPAVWDFAIQGYSDNLDSTALLFAGVGRYITDYLRIDVRAEHRGDYHYSKFQTGLDTGTPSFTGDARTRKFDLSSDSVMLSGWLDLGHLYPNLLWETNQFSIQPFVGAGLGVNYMNVKDFRTIGAPFGVNRFEIASINQTTTSSKFAWHASAGLSAKFTERTSLAVGYNYFDGGKIPFPDFIYSSLSAPSGRSGVSVTPWRGRLKANEVFAELRVLI